MYDGLGQIFRHRTYTWRPGRPGGAVTRPFAHPLAIPIRQWQSRRMLRIGQPPAEAGDLQAAAAQVSSIYRAVLRRDPTTEELQAAAQAISVGLVTPAGLEDTLRHRPYIPWKYLLWGGAGIAGVWFLLLRR